MRSANTTWSAVGHTNPRTYIYAWWCATAGCKLDEPLSLSLLFLWTPFCHNFLDVIRILLEIPPSSQIHALCTVYTSTNYYKQGLVCVVEKTTFPI
jgi:hypothetical protein